MWDSFNQLETDNKLVDDGFAEFMNQAFKDVENVGEEGLKSDESPYLKNGLKIADDNYAVITKMIALYFIELNLPKYKERFKNDIALFTTVGVLDAQIYVFQEKTISIKRIQELAERSLNNDNPLLEFTIGLGILISIVEEPGFLIEDIDYAWNSQRDFIARNISNILHSSPIKSFEKEVVIGHIEMFFDNPLTKKYRNKIGII